jgi:hypothetical protein
MQGSDTKSDESRERYLALCINTSQGSIYKKMAEIDMSDIQSDSELFEKMKEEYHAKRWKWWINSNWLGLVKPCTVHFISVCVKGQPSSLGAKSI